MWQLSMLYIALSVEGDVNKLSLCVSFRHCNDVVSNSCLRQRGADSSERKSPREEGSLGSYTLFLDSVGRRLGFEQIFLIHTSSHINIILPPDDNTEASGVQARLERPSTP
jgi:hypothetical protein